MTTYKTQSDAALALLGTYKASADRTLAPAPLHVGRSGRVTYGHLFLGVVAKVHGGRWEATKGFQEATR